SVRCYRMCALPRLVSHFMERGTDRYSDEALDSFIKLGKAHGITKQEAVEVVTQLAFYCGWPKAWSTFPMIDQVWADEVE
ncbi:MAG: carboxymuconolactone decarboxylase family protein, partial [Atopobiaceae bacterium]|nr:carboxymuconolactone decarboxylase family protein [Atopobiaceae bacterium]